MKVIETIRNIYESGNISTTLVVATLIVSIILGLYECLAYKFVSNRTLHNKSMLIAIVSIPAFISTIILCLQSNVVITLGTIGALAIIRFRTAVKEPVDMVYLLWSIHSGIMIGCQLYEISILTSLVVTILLLGFTLFKTLNKQYTLIIKTKKPVGSGLLVSLLKKDTISYKVSATNYSNDSFDYVIDLKAKDKDNLINKLTQDENIVKFSLLESNGEE